MRPGAYRGLGKLLSRLLAQQIGDDMAQKVLPSQIELFEELSDLRNLIHDIVKEDVKEVWSLDKRMLSHKKRTEVPIADWTRVFGDVWALGLSLSWYLLPRPLRVHVNALFRWLGITQIRCSVGLSTAFKALTKFAKKAKDEVWSFWAYLVDWQNVGGIHGEAMSEEVRKKWNDEVKHANVPIVHTDAWNEAFKRGVREVVNAWPWKVRWDEILTPAEFVKRPNLWATSGSVVNSKRLKYALNGMAKLKKAAPTKWNTAIASSFDELLDIMEHPGKDQYVASPFPKVESVFRTVPRIVTNASMSLYMNMSCLYQIFERGYHGSKLGLGWQGDNLLTMQEYMFFSLLASLDQGAFDHHVTWIDIVVMLDELEAKVASLWPDSKERWYPEVFLRVKDLIKNCYLDLDDGMLLWMNGILSGWKFTSMFDTIANIAQAYACAELYNLPKPVCCGMGDDYIEKVDSEGTGLARMEAMVSNGYDLKPGDTAIGDLGEFVRYVIGRGKVFGYPIRSVASYLWKANVSEYPTIGLGNLGEVLSQYCTSVGRGLDERSCRSLANQSLCRIWGTNEALVWAASPSSLGGGGMWEWTTGFDLVAWDSIPDKREFFDEAAITPSYDLSSSMLRLGVPIAKLNEVVRSVATIRGLKSKVVKGNITRSRRMFVPNTNSSKSSRSSFPLAPVWKFEFSSSLGWDVAVAEAASRKDWGFFTGKFQPTSTSETCFDVLRQKGNQRVVAKWLTGKMPFSSPRYSKFNALVIKSAYEPRRNWAWNKVMCMSHIRWSVISEYAVCVESDTFAELKTYPERFTDWTP